VETYSVRPEDIHDSRSKTIARVAIFVLLCFSFDFLLQYLSSRFDTPRSFTPSTLDAGVFAAIFGLWFVVSEQRGRNVKITVDGDLLVSKVNGSFRKLHRDQIKTIIERKANFFSNGGMILSRYGRIGTRFHGGIWVPRELENYDVLISFVRRETDHLSS
jgi:hypothetical protein